MSKEKRIEEMEFTDVDIIANDINQHCADLAETYCGGTNCLTCLAHALTAKGYRKQSKANLTLLSELKKEVHDRAVYPCSQEMHSYISLRAFDGIIQKYINKYRENKT